MEQVSLAALDAHFGDDVPNRFAVDPFGNDFAPEFLSRFDDRADDALFFRAFVEVFNETRTVDFDYVRPPVFFEA